MSDTPQSRSLPSLLPCPMCGGEAAPNTIRYSASHVREQNWGQDTFHGVNCVVCGLDNKGIVGHRTPEDAAAKWNRRFTSSETGWIKVEDRLPEQRVRVLAWDGLAVEDCFYGVSSNRGEHDWSTVRWRLTGLEDSPRRPITHWMPLPMGPDRQTTNCKNGIEGCDCGS